jgi:type VI secretion system secreted protein VgrG
MGLSSGEDMHLSSGGDTALNAGGHLSLNGMKNVSASVNKSVGLFARSGEAKLIANQGAVLIQAQHNSLSLLGLGQVSISSSDDEIVISTPKSLTLNGGGSYLKLSVMGIEHGSLGDWQVKAINYLNSGTSDSLPNETPDFSVSEIAEMNEVSSKALHD